MDFLRGEQEYDDVEYRRFIRRDPCSYCPRPLGGTVDHIIPRAKRGLDDPSNYTGACEGCNQSKKDESLLEFLLRRCRKV